MTVGVGRREGGSRGGGAASFLLPLALLSLARDACAVTVQRFDDNDLFRLVWPGDAEAPDDLLAQYQEDTLSSEAGVVISTADNERYLCAVPQASDSEGSRNIEYFGPSPRQLLQPLYQQRSCTYRIEVYWTYELCHGRYILQYHEEKEAASRKPARQEYYLGQYMADTASQEEADYDHLHPPKRKVEEQLLPYYPVRYLQGTLCDINGKPRQTTVYYVCIPGSKNQIYSFEEVSSCEYEMVVLSPLLCSHPAFKTEEKKDTAVSCYPVDGAPPKPTALTVWEREQQWETRQQHKKIVFGSGGTAKEDVEIIRRPKGGAGQLPTTPPPPPPTDGALVESFLSGDYCLYGGAGWWKHEYCHGRQVIQFHEDAKTGERTDISLGVWDEAAHVKWIAEHPHKRPLRVDGKIRQVSQYFPGGDYCEETGKRRWVEVRLRCRETKGNSQAVTLYLLEPKTCEYILGVESQMFCDILQTAEQNGLLKKKP